MVWIVAADGTRLCTSLHLPDGDGPWPALLEALPYRNDDVTPRTPSDYDGWPRPGSPCCRVDLRGTGSSDGIATDEYPDAERADLRDGDRVARRAGRGAPGGSGCSARRTPGSTRCTWPPTRVPELGAVVAIYATDDRYTDDVHYCGGVLRAIDLVDYVLVHGGDERAAAGAGGVPGERVARTAVAAARSTRRRRGCSTGSPSRSTGRCGGAGSLRLGPDGAGYERISARR